MTLREYLDGPGVTATALADRCAVAVSTITRIAAGGATSLEIARRIKTETKGVVDLMETQS